MVDPSFQHMVTYWEIYFLYERHACVYNLYICLFNYRLMPEAALTAPKEKRLTGRQWFESGRAAAVIYTSPLFLSNMIELTFMHFLTRILVGSLKQVN